MLCVPVVALWVMFQHTAARRRLSLAWLILPHHVAVSTHSRPKAADAFVNFRLLRGSVSTHSRPKAAEDK